MISPRVLAFLMVTTFAVVLLALVFLRADVL
jgi:hypothetical protein